MALLAPQRFARRVFPSPLVEESVEERLTRAGRSVREPPRVWTHTPCTQTREPSRPPLLLRAASLKRKAPSPLRECVHWSTQHLLQHLHSGTDPRLDRAEGLSCFLGNLAVRHPFEIGKLDGLALRLG